VVRRFILALAVAIAFALLAVPAILAEPKPAAGTGPTGTIITPATSAVSTTYSFPSGFPNCWWKEGHWGDQLYIDKYGNETNVPQWIPGQ
jgi:hypothetical protein